MLTRAQKWMSAALGFGLWIAGILVIRYTWRYQLFGDHPTGIASYVISIPLAFGMVWIMRRAAGLTKHQLPSGVAIAVAVAGLADGLAMTWAQALYGGSGSSLELLPVAAWLLWVIGCVLAVASLSKPWEHQ
jgi:hypothetical protein